MTALRAQIFITVRTVTTLTRGRHGRDNNIHSKVTDISARTKTPVQRYFDCHRKGCHMLVAFAIATRLVLAGGSGSTLYTNNHAYIVLTCIVHVGQINEILINKYLMYLRWYALSFSLPDCGRRGNRLRSECKDRGDSFPVVYNPLKT